MERVNLVLDTRETQLKNALDYLKMLDTSSKTQMSSLSIEVRRLDLGDMLIETKDDASLCLLVERKTIADAYASFRDGRFLEQKQRIKDFSNTHTDVRVMYVFEGFDMRQGQGKFDSMFLLKTMISLTCSENIRVFRTADLNETAYTLVALCNKIGRQICDGKLEFRDRVCLPPKHGGRMSATPETFYTSMLHLIPGVSPAISHAITKEYPTLKSLMNAYQEHGSELIENVTVQYNKRQRRIGKQVSQRIGDFLLVSCKTCMLSN